MRGAGVVELEPALGRGQRPVDAEPHGPEAHGAVEGHHHVGVVREGGRHPVAGPHPEVAQGVGGPVRLGVEVGVGEPPRPGHQRLAGRVVGQRGVEHPGDGRRHGPHAADGSRPN